MSAPRFEGKWKALRKDIVGQLDSPTKSDLQLVDRLVVNMRLAEEATALAEEQPYVEGSTGQLKEHPGFQVASRCDKVTVSLARQLRVTPFVRLRGGDVVEPKAEEDDPILRARDELAARRAARAA